MPVPTAVPPSGSSRDPGEHAVEPLGGVAAPWRRSRRTPGRASPGWRPSGGCGRTSPASANSSALRVQRSLRASPSAGSRSSTTASVAATWIEVGKVSLLDWLALTWSLGCTSTPAARGERGEHLVDVHVGAGARAGLEDVDAGTASSCSPAATSLGRRARSRRPARASRTPSSPLTRGRGGLDQRQRVDRARGSSGVPLIGKFSTARWVCARHRASRGHPDLAHGVVLGAVLALVEAVGVRSAHASERTRPKSARTVGAPCVRLRYPRDVEPVLLVAVLQPHVVRPRLGVAEDLAQRRLELRRRGRPTRPPARRRVAAPRARVGEERRAVERGVGRRAPGSRGRCRRRAAPGRTTPGGPRRARPRRRRRRP